ncbi:MAG: GFA family protein [Porticoccaceae bacterium]
MATEPVTGGCFCGALRYRIDQVAQVANCHCSMCRRTSGAPFVSWRVVPDHFAYTQGTPTHLKSSPRGDRYFRAVCGTPVACVVENQPDPIDITLGSLDHRNAFTPAIDVHQRGPHWIEIKPVPQASAPEPPLARQ